MFHIGSITRVIGVLLIILSSFMGSGLFVSWFFASSDAMAFLYSSLITLLTGFFLTSLPYNRSSLITKKDGYLIVALGWVGMGLFSSLPYILSGTLSSATDAIFESISGLTTTGASVITDIESLSHGILYWRSITQWIGGLGIIVLTVALFPLLGIGGIELFVAEAPGPTSDKIHPRIQETAKRLWFIYVGLTGILIAILWLLGMTFFDAMCHSFTTMSTGGFSTKNDSIAAFNIPAIQYVLIVFMIIAGTNFGLLFHSFKGRFRLVWENEELRTYLKILAFVSMLLSVWILTHHHVETELAIREALFQVVSIVTTTGFVTADYTEWGAPVILAFVCLMFVGASAGSTSGGIKILRHLVYYKFSTQEFKKILHPQAIIPLKINNKPVRHKLINHITIFLLIYLFAFIISTIIVSILGLDILTAIGATATALGNVGPGIGHVGPTDNFAWLSDSIKWILSFLMLLGRLELFSILILFTPYFWRSI